MAKTASAPIRSKTGTLLSLLALVYLSLVVVTGCASKDEIRGLQGDLQNSVGATKKELKAEIDAAKKQTQEESRQAVEKVRADIGAIATKTFKELKDQQDAAAAQAKSQDELRSKEIQQLRQEHEQLVQQVRAQHEALGRTAADLKQVQEQLADVQKTNLQVVREFQALRTGVQITYGGVLDYLKVEEALLKSSLQRVQTILNGVQQTEADRLPVPNDPKPVRSPAVAPPPPAALPAAAPPPKSGP